VKKVDLNVDIGEGYPHDLALLEFATSASVCCGRHAGNWQLTCRTVELCLVKGVRIGMHPGYPDRKNMGRGAFRFEMRRSWGQSLMAQARAFQSAFSPAYIKPHGGFYNDTARSLLEFEGEKQMLSELTGEFEVIEERWATRSISGSILAEMLGINPCLMGLPKTAHEVIAKHANASLIREGFADRAYLPDGTLVPRSEAGAVLNDPEQIRLQVLKLAPEVDSICLHGDTPNCLDYAELVKRTLVDSGYEVGI
jgi:UPF0271 protein